MNDINKQIKLKSDDIRQKRIELQNLEKQLLELKKKKCEIYAEQYAEYVGKKIEFTRTPGCAKKKGFFLGVGFDDYLDVYFPLIYKENKDGKASKSHYHQCDVPKMYEFDKNVKICE